MKEGSQFLQLGDQLFRGPSLVWLCLKQPLNDGYEDGVFFVVLFWELVFAFLNLFKEFYEQIVVKWQFLEEDCVESHAK